MRIIIDGELCDADNKWIWIHTIEIPPYEAFDPMGKTLFCLNNTPCTGVTVASFSC